ncbi:low affinity iron permease family protein [Streptomyces sp. NPDC007851]|uniref:low affinity iron permease family protein n=1 Tax=Streptomyces sp. NPDC007851 TaxID=3155008 RepID=UPI0033C26E60
MGSRGAVSVAHPAERTRDDGRGWFEKLAETASNFTSSAPFYGFCLLLVALFVAAHLLGLPLSWQLLVGDIMTSVNLLLLALLKNSERRAEHAIQRKLDSIAAALLEQRESREQEGGRSAAEAPQIRDDLRDAIRMEEEL